MALRGNLKELSLPDIFQLVTFSGKTGVLRIVREDGAEGSVWFRDGDIFFAQSNWHTEPLGERLARAQRITPMALDRAVELRAAEPEGGRRLGDILVDEGYITTKVLETFVQQQMQDTIFDLMRWDEGEFEFEAMPDAPEEDIGLSVSIENVIMEGSRRLEEWNRIKKKIPSTDIVFKMATAPGEGTYEISLKPAEWNLLLLVDGTRSVAQLAVETDRTDFEVARIVYGLFSAGLLEFADDAEVVRLRAERVEREEKLAAIEAGLRAERIAAEAKVAKAAESRRAKSEARAALAAEEVGQRVEIPQPATAPAEVPEFLGEGHAAPSPEDMAVLEQMMGAVLEQRPTASQAETRAPETARYVPAEEPAFISASQTDEFAAQMVPVPSVDDLFAGLNVFASESDGVDAAAAAVAEAATAQLAEEEASDAAIEATGEMEPATPPAVEMMLEASIPMPLSDFEFTPAPETAMEPAVAAPMSVLEPAEPVVSETPVEPPVPEEPAGRAAVAPESSALEIPEVLPAAEPVVGAPTHDLFATPPVEPFVVVPAVPVESAEPFVLVPEPVATTEPVAEQPEASVEEPPGLPVLDLEPQAAESAPTEAEVLPQAEPAAPAIFGLGDFEHDLMALGLGELPAELLAPEAAAKIGADTSGAGPGLVGDDFDVDLEPVSEPMGVMDVASQPVRDAAVLGGQDEQDVDLVASSESRTEPGEAVTPPAAEIATPVMDDTVDFSALLESLDISADDAEAAEPHTIDLDSGPGFDADLVDQSVASVGGVISTDAYLEDITMDEGFGMNSELNNELSALTGADRRNRPSASVHRIPDANAEGVLHRDARVDRETLLKIIDGIKNL